MEQEEDGTARERMRAPAVSCPRCGSRPALRISALLIDGVRGEPGTREVGSYKCQRRGCGYIYRITASALQRAE